MPGFWKGPAWLKAKLAPEDDQRPLLLQPLSTPFCLANSSKGNEVENHPSQERYVGFGIGGAGNIRKSDSRLIVDNCLALRFSDSRQGHGP